MLGRRTTLACLAAAVAALLAVGAQAFVPGAPLPLSSGARAATSTRREVVVMGNHRSSQAARRRTSFLRHINAPLHKRRAIMSSPLSKELRAEHGGVRSIPIRTGDEVVVTAGDHRKKTGKVIGVDRKSYKIHVEGITREKAGGKEAGKTSTTIPIPIHPSKVRITKLTLDDSRKAILARRAAGRKVLAEAKASFKLAEAGSDGAWTEYQATLKGILDGSA